MRNIREHLKSRLCWLAVGLGIGIYTLKTGIDQHLWDASVSGIGIAVMDVSGFLHPVLFNEPVLTVPSSTPIGPAGLRRVIATVGLVGIFTGFVLRYVVIL